LHQFHHIELFFGEEQKSVGVTGREKLSWPLARFVLPDLGFVIQDDVQQGIPDFQCSVVFDVAQSAEFVHEMAYARSGRADHLCESFLTDLPDDRLSRGFLAKFAKSRSARANRFSLELNNWSIRSSSIRLFRLNKSAMNNSENSG
jgi:hypothetical protein